MIDLQYSLVIEATDEPDFFGFFSPDLDGFTGTGHSIEDCIYKAKWGMIEHIALIKEHGLSIPPPSPDLEITIRNEGKKEKETQPQGHREVGGPPGPEPTRYGDWEKAGRCIDF